MDPPFHQTLFNKKPFAFKKNCPQSLTVSSKKGAKVLHLKQRILDLEAEIAIVRGEANAKEENLNNRIRVKNKLSQRLQSDLEDANDKTSRTIQELGHAQLGQLNAEISARREQESAHILARTISEDRHGLEEVVSQRIISLSKLDFN